MSDMARLPRAGRFSPVLTMPTNRVRVRRLQPVMVQNACRHKGISHSKNSFPTSASAMEADSTIAKCQVQAKRVRYTACHNRCHLPPDASVTPVATDVLTLSLREALIFSS